MLSGELVEVLRTVTADINSDLVHDLNGLGTNNTRLTSGACDIELAAPVTPQQSFGHLAAG